MNQTAQMSVRSVAYYSALSSSTALFQTYYCTSPGLNQDNLII